MTFVRLFFATTLSFGAALLLYVAFATLKVPDSMRPEFVMASMPGFLIQTAVVFLITTPLAYLAVRKIESAVAFVLLVFSLQTCVVTALMVPGFLMHPTVVTEEEVQSPPDKSAPIDFFTKDEVEDLKRAGIEQKIPTAEERQASEAKRQAALQKQREEGVKRFKTNYPSTLPSQNP